MKKVLVNEVIDEFFVIRINEEFNMQIDITSFNILGFKQNQLDYKSLM